MTYKLTYFAAKALAEPIRFLLSYGEADWVDNRIGFDEWSDFKKQTPFGQVPILEFNGKVAHQSVAISRYLAKQMRLVGDSDLENLEIDAMVDTITDLRTKVSAFNAEKDVSRKQAMKDTLILETMPYYLDRFNAIAESGHLALGKLTWADLYFVGILEYMDGVMEMDISENYPNLQELRKTVFEMPSIHQWINKRPHSSY